MRILILSLCGVLSVACAAAGHTINQMELLGDRLKIDGTEVTCVNGAHSLNNQQINDTYCYDPTKWRIAVVSK